MLITTLQPNGYLAVRFIYCQDYIDRIKGVQGAFYNNILKCWNIPVSSFYQYEQIFYDEIVYQTPRWDITGESPPDYSKIYYINPNIKSPLMKLKPFPYQDFCIRLMIDRLSKNKFFLNCDSMGLGKTFETIGVISYMMQYCGLSKVLIICKKTIKSQWCSEIGKFTNICNKMPVEYTGNTKKKRTELYKKLKKEKKWILVGNYDICLNDVDTLLKLKPQMVIIDEAHVLRNRNGKKNKAIAKICNKAVSVIFLTGTPIQTKPADLYGIISMADKNFFGDWNTFDKRYIKHERRGRYNTEVGVMHLSEIKNKIMPYFISRSVEEVGIQMPDSIQKQIYCELDNVQRNIINVITAKKKKLQDQMNSLYNRRNNPQIKVIYDQKEAMFKGLIAHEQVVADDPRMFLMSKSQNVVKEYGSLVPKNYQNSSKIETLIELVEDILSANEKVIIFSKFSRAIYLIKNVLEQKFNIKVNIATGGNGMSDEVREQNIQEFKTSYDVNVLVATNTLAEGVNLQEARHQINFDQPDSNAIKSQMAGRVRRVGSKYNTVYIYDLLTKESKDEERFANIQKTKALSNGIVGIDKAQADFFKQISR